MARRKKSQSGESKLTAFTLATELKAEHFAGWSASEAATLDDPTAAMKTMLDRLTARGAEITGFYGIFHDRDTREVFDPIAGKYVKEPKFAHIHIVCYFTKREKGLTVSAIAKALGVETNMIEKPRSGRYAVDNLLAYLVHAKDKDKYQYQPEDMVTLVGDDYMDVWAKNRMAWEPAAHGVGDALRAETPRRARLQRPDFAGRVKSGARGYCRFMHGGPIFVPGV